MRWACNKFGGNSDVRTLMVNAIVVLVDCGLVPEQDSDYTLINNPTEVMQSDANDEAIKALVTPVKQRQAATIMVATKANYWLINHHVGQGAFAGFAKKVYSVLLKLIDETHARAAFHTMGH